jgi:hypothetical protein
MEKYANIIVRKLSITRRRPSAGTGNKKRGRRMNKNHAASPQNGNLMKKIFIIDNILMYLFIISILSILLINLDSKITIANYTVEYFNFYVFIFLLYLNIKHIIAIVLLIKERNIYFKDFFYLMFSLLVSTLYIIHTIPIFIIIFEGIEFINDDPKTKILVNESFGLILFDIIMASGLLLSMLCFNRYIYKIHIKKYYNIIVPSVYLLFIIYMYYYLGI